ncbi:MAG: guanine-1-methyltransferase-domain-containing protein [Podila humilis]|nr:MAG: guanine-1-methyltransferase-domain-containing protein [Podila humilis]
MSTIAQGASPGAPEVDHAPSTAQSDNATASDSTATHDSSEITKDASDEHAQKNPFWKPRAPPMLGPDGQPLSRNATKKLLRQQQFLERRPQMRQQEKLKRKQKEKERREAIESGKIAPPPKRQKLDQIQSGITIGIDMSFDDLMLEKEVKSMVDQIKRCYSYNRTCEKIVHIALTSFTGKSKEEFTKRANGYELWKNFTLHEDGLEKIWPSDEIPGNERLTELKKLQVKASIKSEAIKAQVLATASSHASETSPEEHQEISASTPSDQTMTATIMEATSSDSPSTGQESSKKDYKALEMERHLKEEKLATIPAVKKIVYLSADSPNTITHLEPGTSYILGGIVDKNRFPRLCQDKAEKLGLETAQLPIGDYIQMSSRRILTVNQVFEILLQFIECNDWKEAFLKVIPQRKLEEKQRIRRGTEAWKAKYGDQGKGRPSASASGSNSVASSVADEDESGCEDSGDEDDVEHEGEDGAEQPHDEDSK